MRKLLIILIVLFASLVIYELYCRYHFVQIKNGFVEMTYEDDFKAFQGYDFIIRGCDLNGDSAVVCVSMNDSNYYKLICDKTGQTIYSVDSIRGFINQDSLKQLLPTFMSMNISRLRINKGGNVYVYIVDFENENLVRFFDENEKRVFMKKVGFDFWKEHYDSLSGLWFEFKQ